MQCFLAIRAVRTGSEYRDPYVRPVHCRQQPIKKQLAEAEQSLVVKSIAAPRKVQGQNHWWGLTLELLKGGGKAAPSLGFFVITFEP